MRRVRARLPSPAAAAIDLFVGASPITACFFGFFSFLLLSGPSRELRSHL
jgi:hypothetical protein